MAENGFPSDNNVEEYLVTEAINLDLEEVCIL